MRGARVNLLRKRELADAFQPEKRRMSKNVLERVAQRYVTPYRKPDESSLGMEQKLFGDHGGRVITALNVTASSARYATNRGIRTLCIRFLHRARDAACSYGMWF
jgi:hypothetical protein